MPQLPLHSSFHLPSQERSDPRPRLRWFLVGTTFILCLFALNFPFFHHFLTLSSNSRHEAWRSFASDPVSLRPKSSSAASSTYELRSTSLQAPISTPTLSNPPASTPSPSPPASSQPTKDPTQLFWENNAKKLEELRTCVASHSCRPNQDRLIITFSHHIMQAVTNWYTGGEEIWAKSLIRAWDALGYTWYHTFDMEVMKDLYEEFRNNTDMILTPDDYAIGCFHDSKCVYDPDINPRGLPIWKLFSFFFWAEPSHPLGGKWTLNPENYGHQHRGGNTYIGYSVEENCMAHRFIPHSERPGTQAYIYAKKLSYFAPTRNRAYPPEWYKHASERISTMRGSLTMIAGVSDDLKDHPGEWPSFEGMPVGIQNFGHMSQNDFIDKVAHSSVLVGVGNPPISPTPYEALCLGVPFINPILRWDNENRTNRDTWDSQHSELKFFNPPYVYNVHTDDEDAFIGALQAALENPIDRYILPEMHQENVTARVSNVLTSNWRKAAEDLLARRIKSGKGSVRLRSQD